MEIKIFKNEYKIVEVDKLPKSGSMEIQLEDGKKESRTLFNLFNHKTKEIVCVAFENEVLNESIRELLAQLQFFKTMKNKIN